MPDSSLLPITWVQKRDGRVVPFEADKICQALFAATEDLGQPDAFLARELTDGILHFLAHEAGPSPLSTAQIADLIVKVVRELGQPTLAQQFAEGKLQKTEDSGQRTEEGIPGRLHEWVQMAPADVAWRTAGACLREYALRQVFSRDLVAAQADGFLTLHGLEAPLEMAGWVLPPLAEGMGLLEALEAARGMTGDLIALDGPEYLLAAQPSPDVAASVRELTRSLRLTGLRAVVNLNSSTPPPWADTLAEGPLFAAHQHGPAPEHLQELAEALREQFGSQPAIRIDWHLTERDFAPAAEARLARLARAALSGDGVAFVFDRLRRPVTLAEGLDRQHPALLLAVGLHLERLTAPDAERFLQKLGSLARLALSAAVQKREFLRRHSAARQGLTRGFALDRARLLVTPLGLDSAARALTGQGVWDGPAGIDLVRQMVQRLHAALGTDGRSYRLDVALSPRTAPFGGAIDPPIAFGPPAVLKTQLRAAGPWQAMTELGSVSVSLPEEHPPAVGELVELLRHVWRRTEIVRLQFVAAHKPARPVLAAWAMEPCPGVPRSVD